MELVCYICGNTIEKDKIKPIKKKYRLINLICGSCLKRVVSSITPQHNNTTQQHNTTTQHNINL